MALGGRICVRNDFKRRAVVFEQRYVAVSPEILGGGSKSDKRKGGIKMSTTLLIFIACYLESVLGAFIGIKIYKKYKKEDNNG